jgi:ADP-heptose:LPS heptosyltransferase
MKSYIKEIFGRFTDNIISLFLPKNEAFDNYLLLIRLDSIGDYILFRNFIAVLKNSEKFRNYKFIFAGNIIWKDISEELDKEYIEKFIWIDLKKITNPLYRFKKLRELSYFGYDYVISPVQSRRFFYGDAIVKFVNAKEKICPEGDLSIITMRQKKIADKYFTKLIDSENEIIFEFYRNKRFFENLIGIALEIKKPEINFEYKNSDVLNKFGIKEGFVVLFIGASENHKVWDAENFAKVAQYINNKYNLKIVLCGGKSDVKYADKFKSFFKGEYLDLTGKTSLMDFVKILSKSNLLITNDTFAQHLAVAINLKNIIVLFNGNDFERFVPYPEEMVKNLNYNVIFHPEMERDIESYGKIAKNYGFKSNLNINDIRPEEVIKKIDKVLNK